MKQEHRLSAEAIDRIAKSVAAAELKTSAEIKVIVLRYCWTDLLRKGQELFEKHRLHLTQDRSAVMILMVTVNREFLIYGDKGIHERVDERTWRGIRDAMAEKFKSHDLVAGLCLGVDLAAEKLATFFPHSSTDVNEIPDEVIHEE